jgi:recombinational DNA repair protein (RecF pathway)
MICDICKENCNEYYTSRYPETIICDNCYEVELE